jgi:hypothetical protein
MQENHMRLAPSLLVSMLLFVVTASVDASSARSYSVVAQLSHSGQTFGEPSAIVRAGEPATVELSGADGYKLTLAVDDLGNEMLRVTASLRSRFGQMSPILVVKPGVPAGATVEGLSLTLTVTKSAGKDI